VTSDVVQRASWGDLKGLRLAALVRMSTESLNPQSDDGDRFMTGRDIVNRETQEADCQAFIAARGGEYVFTYEEPDTSAWKRRRVRTDDGRIVYRVIRPVFEGALEDLKRGLAPNGQVLDGIVVYDLDRFTRDNRHLEDAIDVVTHHHRVILDTTGSIDLLTANGQAMARVLVSMSGKSSADTSRRVTRKAREMQSEGIPGGGPRPFGWSADRRTLDETEAGIVREGAERLLHGAPVSALVIDWNTRGIATVYGNAWTNDTVRMLYRHPRLCGIRARWVFEYNPATETENKHLQIVTDAAGQPVNGQWEPILTVKEWEDVVALIGDRNSPRRGKNSRKYLLTGILRCGKDQCNQRLRPKKAPSSVKTPGRYHYSCKGKTDGGCGGVGISGPETEELITAAVLAKYDRESASRSTEDEVTEWAGEEELARVTADIAELTKSWRSGTGISRARYFALLPDLEAEEKRLRRERQKWIAHSAAAQARPLDVRGEWDAYTLPEKRALIEEALVAVIVHPANGTINRYAERLELIWREE
jgi:site-specific DNA recombinase